MKISQDGKIIVSNDSMLPEECQSLAVFIRSRFTHEALKFTELSLHQVRIEDQGIAELLHACTFAGGLRCLKLSKVEIGQKTLAAIKDLLEVRPPHDLKELRLIDLTGYWDRQLEELYETISLSDLRILQLTGFKLQSETSLRCIYDLLTVNQYFKDLDISGCKLTQSSFEYILESLFENETLQALSLARITIFSKKESDKRTAAIIERLCEFLSVSTSLTHLDLSYMLLSGKTLV